MHGEYRLRKCRLGIIKRGDVREMDNLEVARGFAEDIFEVTGDTILHYAAIVTAFATLAIAEKMYEEVDAPDLVGDDVFVVDSLSDTRGRAW